MVKYRGVEEGWPGVASVRRSSRSLLKCSVHAGRIEVVAVWGELQYGDLSLNVNPNTEEKRGRTAAVVPFPVPKFKPRCEECLCRSRRARERLV